ncbi:hypothetical protein [Streptacidiphilus sp. PAMC 29251]
MAGDKAGRHHAFAAWTLAGAGEFTAAHASLVKAVAAGAPDLLCTWIRCVIEHEGPGFPTGTAELRQASVEQIDIEPFYRIFLAHSAHAASDLSEAMRYLEEALEASPHSSMLQVALARVLLARVAASMSHVPTLDLRRAMDLCRTAREQRLAWAGPSEEPLVELLHCHIMASDFDTAQRLATAWPAGDALAREAACGLVAFLGVRVALSLGDTVGAEVIADSAQDPQYSAAIRLMVSGEPNRATSVQGWQNVLENAGDLDLDIVVYAVSRLADSGTWPIQRLEALRASGLITIDGYEMLQARSEAARGDLHAAKRRLRPHVTASPLGAETLVEVLESAGDLEEALDACTSALRRFANAPLRMRQWHLLTRLGRSGEAAALAAEILGRPELAAGQRETLRRSLIWDSWNNRDWSVVDDHCRASIGENPHHVTTEWDFIASAYSQQRWGLAWERMAELNPPIVTAEHAQLWLALHAYFGFSPQDASLALDLIDRWPEDQDLLRRVVTILLSRGNKVNALGQPIIPPQGPELVERFQAALARHTTRNPEALEVVTDYAAKLDSLAADFAARAPAEALIESLRRSGRLPPESFTAAAR